MLLRQQFSFWWTGVRPKDPTGLEKDWAASFGRCNCSPPPSTRKAQSNQPYAGTSDPTPFNGCSTSGQQRSRRDDPNFFATSHTTDISPTITFNVAVARYWRKLLK